MILEQGDKILVAHRRMFQEDAPRFFTGVVERCEGDLVCATGHSWIRNLFEGHVVRKDDVRTKILSLSSGALMVYRLPKQVELETLEVERGIGTQLVMTDGQEFVMDISEVPQTD